MRRRKAILLGAGILALGAGRMVAQQYATVPYVITAVKLAQRDATNWVAAQNYCTSCNGVVGYGVAYSGTLVGFITGGELQTNSTTAATLTYPVVLTTNMVMVGSL